MQISESVKGNAISLFDMLRRYDPLNKTKFEVSFKLINNTVPSQIRFLNMDGNVYSCKSRELFLLRLALYRKIIKNKINNPMMENIFKALENVSKTPMDLYFGVDIKDGYYLFSFWLIFGGVKRTGEVSFWPYKFDEIIDKVLFQIKFKKPRFLRKDILNLGFDVDSKNIFYKLYYLLKDKEENLFPFTNLMKRINRRLSDFKYFYFFSQMYDQKAECIKRKLFLEFLEDIYSDSKRTEEVLKKILEVSNNYFDLRKLFKIIKLINGRISLISFEIDGTLTFYIRPD